MADSPASFDALTRRDLLRTGARLALAGGAFAVVGCSSRTTEPGSESPSSNVPTQGLATPNTATVGPVPPASTEIRSEKGLLKTTLLVAGQQVPFGEGKRWALTVNGQTPGPTLVARPGDHLSITLQNQTGASTNLHTHGLGVSPSGSADNPFIEVPNGQSHTYEMDIPAGHPGGTFWYHPHFHHHVAEQLFAGFFGLIVVEDDVDAMPAVKGALQRNILLHDTRIASNAADVMRATMMEQRNGREGEVLVSGARAPAFTGQTAQLERWRILNASPSRFYRIALADHDFQVIGTDGGRLGKPVTRETLTLVPGERLEVLVRYAGAGSFQLRGLPIDRGAMSTSPELLLASINVSNSGPAPELPASLGAFEGLGSRQVDRKRELVFAMQGQMGGARFLIDGREFDASRVDIKVTSGTVEDWTIRNTSPMDHPFHLHVWPFQVVTGAPADQAVQGWKDVVNVPANSSVTVRIPFVGIKGKTVYHCHILDHEDLGMMGIIEVS